MLQKAEKSHTSLEGSLEFLYHLIVCHSLPHSLVSCQGHNHFLHEGNTMSLFSRKTSDTSDFYRQYISTDASNVSIFCGTKLSL